MEFINTQIFLIDSVLTDIYDKPIERKDYLTFIDWFDRKLSNTNNEFNSIEINIHNERVKWGKKTYNGKRYWKLQEILNTLVDKLILNKTGYLVGEHSIRYSYTQQYINAIELNERTFLVNEPINDKLYNILINYKYSNNDIKNPQYKLLMSNRFDINIDKGLTKLISMVSNDDIQTEQSFTKLKCILNIKRMYDMKYKRIFCSTIPNGRVYTSFNNIKRELREFVLIDGEYLNSIDLKSSQPLLFAYYMMSKYSNVSDVQKYFDIVTYKDIYNWLGLKSRIEAKTEMFRYLFKTTNKGVIPVDKIMKDKLPELHSLVMRERIHFAVSGNNIANYLQSIEATLFMGVQNSYVDKGCLSVFDGLYFKTAIENEIRDELNQSLIKHNITKYELKLTKNNNKNNNNLL